MKKRGSGKFIFLDVDGVLNHITLFRNTNRRRDAERDGLPYGAGSIDPACVERVNRIAKACKASVVVSSSWRCGRSIKELDALFRSRGATFSTISKTPDLTTSGGGMWTAVERHREIDAWLHSTSLYVESFVILDDDADANIDGHFIRTSFDTGGLQDEHADRAIAILRATSITHNTKQRKATQS